MLLRAIVPSAFRVLAHSVPTEACKVETGIVIPGLQVRNERHRKAERLTPRHTAVRQGAWPQGICPETLLPPTSYTVQPTFPNLGYTASATWGTQPGLGA